MRKAMLALALLPLAGCNPAEVAPAEDGQGVQARPAVESVQPSQPQKLEPPPSADAPPPAAEPPEGPALAGMSPYRRREYQRGYRDCMSGDYDRERQGESYRLGCMAAENAKSEPPR